MTRNELIQSRLAEAIRRSDLTQTEIARRLGVKQPTVGQYISGRIMPSLDTFAELCVILEENPAYLLGLTD
ncbi:MAG: helix-turn-helix domain-containing protein [Candidatus Coproplasma sp.]